MNIALKTMCRGDGKAYVLVDADGLDEASSLALCVTNGRGRPIPSSLFPLPDGDAVKRVEPPRSWFDAARRSWCCSVPASRSARAVAVIPLLEIDRWTLVFTAVDERGVVVSETSEFVSATALKWRSRVNYRLRARSCAAMKDVDVRESSVSAHASFERAIEDGNETIMRAQIDVPFHASSEVRFSLLDERGEVGDSAGMIALEDARYRRNPTGEERRALTLSARIPSGMRGATLLVADDKGCFAPCFATLDRGSFEGLLNATRAETMSAEHDPRYHEWFKTRAATPLQLATQSSRTIPAGATFSVVVPLYRTPIAYYRAMLQSVLSQSYGAWELILVNASPEDERLAAELAHVPDERIRIVELEGNGGIAENTNAGIAVAKGDFVAFLDHDDMLAPDALYEYVCAVHDDGQIDLLYCDEDRVDSAGRYRSPFFKPEYSPELLHTHNYITHFLAIRRSLIEDIGPLDAAFDGAQDYDLVLRASEKARVVAHIPRVLYHWRMHEASTSMNSDSKSYAGEAGRAALESHCRRLGWHARVERTDLPFAYRVRHELAARPSVSILIPNKDKISLLSACVDSILEKSSYDAFEIVVIENNSVEPETFTYYDELRRLGKARVIEWPDAFNFSKIVNYGVRQTEGEYVLLLNNDTEVISSDFLETMMGCFQAKGVGVVGAKLLFPDRTVQHGGVALGPYRSAGHLFASLPEDDPGYFCRAVLPQDLSAVTGACQLFPRELFERVGGYTEAFEVGLNDVDFCLKVREAGFRVVWTPYAKLFHYEFSSRGRDRGGAQMERAEREIGLLRSRWSCYFQTCDPYIGPNVDPDSLYFGLGRA